MAMKFTSTKLVPNLENLRSRITGKQASARITVPQELDWWFFQEFGTATHFNEGTVEVPEGIMQAPLPDSSAPQGYTIEAKYAGAIRLPITSEFPEAWEGKTVHHPGVSPKAFIRSILPEIYEKSSSTLVQALIENQYDLEDVQGVLMTEVMPEVLSDIVDSMASSFSNGSDRDTPGRLGNRTPSDVFESAALIVDSRGE